PSRNDVEFQVAEFQSQSPKEIPCIPTDCRERIQPNLKSTCERLNIKAAKWRASTLESLQFPPERKRNGAHQKRERHHMIPFQALSQIRPRENHKNAKRDDLLNYLQLKSREFAVPDPVRGHLKAIFRERNQPAHDDRGKERSFPVFQMAVPGDGHKNIRANQQ